MKIELIGNNVMLTIAILKNSENAKIGALSNITNKEISM